MTAPIHPDAWARACRCGLIGVVAALLASNQPLGFVAILGVLALIGIIIRNTVILVTQTPSAPRGWGHGRP